LTNKSANNPQWERDIIRKLRSIICLSGKPIEQIFYEFDVDRTGTLNTKEFRNAMRALQVGLSSKEIDKIM
jgi:hypothetical protein